MQKIPAKLHSMSFTQTIFSKLNPDQPYFKTSYTKFHKNLTNSSVANTKSRMGRQGLSPQEVFYTLFKEYLKSVLHIGIKAILLFSVFLTCLLFFDNYCSPAFITSFPQSLYK